MKSKPAKRRRVGKARESTVPESELVQRLQEFLRSSDLNTTTTAIVLRRLEEFFGVDLSDRKAFIREQVDLFLQSQMENEKGEEEDIGSDVGEGGGGEEENEEEGEEESEEEVEEDSEEEEEEFEEEEEEAARNGKDRRKRAARNGKDARKRARRIMSQDRSLSATASNYTGCTSSTRITVTVTPNGQIIGENAAKLSTTVGRVVKTHMSPTYDRWTEVPDELKERVWCIVSSMFDVLPCHKELVLKKANALWRDWKSCLRREVYDKYLTDTERKNHIPKYVKKEDWERFVDICSTPRVQAARQLGKQVRKAMKSVHTSGRKGQARVAEELRQKNPAREITRTEIYLATHTRKDGSATSGHIDVISKMLASDPSIAQRDLDHDPVAMALGPDSRGRIRGMGMGVSKTTRHYTSTYMASCQSIQTQIDELKKQLAEESRQRKMLMDQILASISHGGMQVLSSIVQGNSSQVDSPHHEAQPNPTTAQRRMSSCKLMHIYHRSTCVAYGRVMADSIEDPGCYRIIVDGILEWDTDLLNREGKFSDLTFGDIIEWPKFRTVFD